MIDTSPLEKYLTDIDSIAYSQAEHTIERIGFDKWFENQLNNWCNCELTCRDGRRMLQTNDKRYSLEISVAYAMIDKYSEDNKDYYYEKLLIRHNANLEFEAINGLEYDIYSSKKSTKSTRKKTNQTLIEFDDKPKKETVADKKLKAHLAKISMLKLKITPVNNDNTL